MSLSKNEADVLIFLSKSDKVTFAKTAEMILPKLNHF